MKKRKFGRLDFEVSEISFGGGAVSGEGGGYGFGDLSEADSTGLLRAALERGINLFDTAPCYGYGMSERRFAKAFRDRRDEVFLVSKCGVTWDENKKFKTTNDPEVARRMLEQSLRDLETDRIDLYFIHWPDKKIDVRRTMEVLSQAKREGKIGAIGLSNFYDVEEVERAMEIDRVDAFQTQFNLFRPEAAEKLFPFARENEIAHMSWGSFDKGILTGRVKRGREFPASDFRSRYTGFIDEGKMRAMDRIEPLLEENGSDGRALALGFILSHPEASTAVCGVKSVEQLDTAIAAAENPPSPDVVEAALRIAREETGAAA
jgi:aryl-alcohol dehydrogenase-like predicted oxidoreductase